MADHDYDDEDATERIKLKSSQSAEQRMALIKAGGMDMNAQRFDVVEMNNRVLEDVTARSKAGERGRVATTCRTLLLWLMYAGLAVCACYAMWASMVLERPGESARRG
jgi:hypothetical protein